MPIWRHWHWSRCRTRLATVWARCSPLWGCGQRQRTGTKQVRGQEEAKEPATHKVEQVGREVTETAPGMHSWTLGLVPVTGTGH